jgi:lysophospholipase L1-like esterase
VRSLTLAAATVTAICLLAGSASSHAARPVRCSASHWVASWIDSPSDAVGGLDASLQHFHGGPRQTYRMIITPHLGGALLRVALSNRFGSRPVRFTRVTIAREAAGAALVRGTVRTVRFGRRETVTVGRGGQALSDPVRLRFRAFENLAVSLYVPVYAGYPTEHFTARQTSYYTRPRAGDRASDPTVAGFAYTTTARYWVDGLDVLAPRRVGAVVAFGDSLTDGYQGPPSVFPETAATLNTNGRWPDDLQRRLLAARMPLSILNAGISGNELLGYSKPPYGPPGVLRFRRDALAQPGVRGVIALEGGNDIAAAGRNAAQIEAGLRRLVGMAHRAGLKILLGTLTPALGGTRYEETIDQVNAWIRRGGAGSNGYVDFWAAVRDPAPPGQLLPAYDGGDGVHLDLAGYRAMADAVSLSALRSMQPRCAG